MSASREHQKSLCLSVLYAKKQHQVCQQTECRLAANIRNNCGCLCCVQKDSTLMKLAAMEGAVPKQLQPTFKKVVQRLQQVS